MAEKQDVNGPAAQMPSAEQISKSLIDGAEALLTTQAKLFSAFEAMTADWLRRQREAFNEAQQSLRAMRECQTPADVMKVQQAWIASAAKRMNADLTALGQATNSMTQQAMQDITATGRNAMSLMESSRQEFMRAAGNKPSKS
jgi:histidinol-phosphate/aromatic aminotransferase/cobyric acid decarboxylase-like protein